MERRHAMHYSLGMIRAIVLVLAVVAAMADYSSGAYDAIVVEGPALNAASSDSVAQILTDKLNWKVGVLNLKDTGRFNFVGVKLLYFPGATFLDIRLPDNAEENIRHAVVHGMGWIGTCGGSLIAAQTTRGGENIGLFPGSEKFGGITGNRTFVFDVAHPIVANSSVKDRITPELEMHVNGGPSDYILNRYSERGVNNWIVARYGDSEGGKPAVVAVLYGKGRVFLTAAHPERPQYMPADIAKAPQVIEMAAEWCAGVSDPGDKGPPAVKTDIPSEGDAGSVLLLSAVGSSDTAGYPLGFIWDFGDRSAEATTPLTRHTFAEPGNYIVTLVVTDGRRSSTVKQAVKIKGEAKDSPPTVGFVQPFNGNLLSGNVEIVVKAFDRDEGSDDGSGIGNVTVALRKDDKVVMEKSFPEAPYVWPADLSNVPAGSYELKATAVSSREKGAESSATMSVTVDNASQLVRPFTGMSQRRPRSRPRSAGGTSAPADVP
jgi:hypothetical protein